MRSLGAPANRVRSALAAAPKELAPSAHAGRPAGRTNTSAARSSWTRIGIRVVKDRGGATSDITRVFSDEVYAGSSQKMRPNTKPKHHYGLYRSPSGSALRLSNKIGSDISHGALIFWTQVNSHTQSERHGVGSYSKTRSTVLTTAFWRRPAMM